MRRVVDPEQAATVVGIGRYDVLVEAVAPDEVVSVHQQYRNRTEVLAAVLRGLGVDTPPIIAGGSGAPSDGCSTLGVSVGAPM